MASKKLCDNIVFPIIRRYASVTQQTTTTKTARSLLLRLIEDRRRKSQQDDIRLEPYMSKGVYTESGAIRPVSKRNMKNFYYPINYTYVYFDI